MEQSTPPPPLPTQSPAPVIVPAQKPVWYKSRWFHVILFIFFPYIQVPLMWMWKLSTRRTRIIVTVFGVLMVVGMINKASRDESPPKGEVKYAINQWAGKIPMASSTSNLGHTFNFTGKLKSYVINNEFEKTIDSETYYVYDVDAKIEGLYGLQDHTMMIGLVRRGERWYSLRLDAEGEPAIQSRYEGR